MAEARLRELLEQQREMKKQGRSPAGFKSGNTALRGFTRLYPRLTALYPIRHDHDT